MRKKFDKEKLLIIGILPLMWFAYFLFELFTGRIKSLYDICLNLSLLFLFALVGWIIYCIQKRYSDGIKNKSLFTLSFKKVAIKTSTASYNDFFLQFLNEISIPIVFKNDSKSVAFLSLVNNIKS